jgi:integrase/recombinase XerD
MNYPPSGLNYVDRNIEGFLYFKMAEGLSDSTLTNYKRAIGLMTKMLDVQDFKAVTSTDLIRHLVWLKTEYRPVRKNRNDKPLSGKTVRNHWVALKSFFRWLNLEYGIPNLMDRVPPPKFEYPPIKPLKESEIKALLTECKYKRKAETFP